MLFSYHGEAVKIPMHPVRKRPRVHGFSPLIYRQMEAAGIVRNAAST
jgi:hypothetical protein